MSEGCEQVLHYLSNLSDGGPIEAIGEPACSCSPATVGHDGL